MAISITKTYNSGPYSLEKILGLALFASMGLHILASWIFFYAIPAYQTMRQERQENVVVVQLMTSSVPPAPAAPDMKVNPDRKGPDVVEMPATPPEAPPQPVVEAPPLSVSDPGEVIPIADKKPETPPVIERVKEDPPAVKPPPRQEAKPAKKPQPSLDSRVNNAIKNVERKVAAENPDDLIAQRIANLNATRGRGQGEGSEISGGSTRGQQIDPEMTRYYAHIRDIVSQNWLPPTGSLSANLVAVYQIKIEPNGYVSNSRLLTSSGNSDYDLSVERAVKKSAKFPPLPPVFGGQAVSPALEFPINAIRH